MLGRWIVFVIFLSFAPRSYAQASLDAFLDGFQKGCSGSQDHQEFVASLGERYTSSGQLTNPIVAPQDIRRTMGRIKVANRGNYMRIVVPVSGTFKGLSVSELEYELGNENGIHTEAVIFSATPRKVRQVLGQDIKQGRLTLAEKFPDRVPSLEIINDKGRAKLLCILSD
jgi:hypothetical protein